MISVVLKLIEFGLMYIGIYGNNSGEGVFCFLVMFFFFFLNILSKLVFVFLNNIISRIINLNIFIVFLVFLFEIILMISNIGIFSGSLLI